MTRASTQVRFPRARSAPFILADLFAQMAVEGVTMLREWKTVGDPRTRAQAYYDLKERLNSAYGAVGLRAPPIGEYGKLARKVDGLWPYQRELIKNIRNHEGPFILGWDLGKEK